MKQFVKTSQLALFDGPASLAARDEGIYRAAENKAALVNRAREIAISIAQRQGAVTMDEVQFSLAAENVSVHALGNSAGAIFRDERFEWTGEYVRSVRVGAHGNLLPKWRLK